jgi:hypothetical protein
LGSNVGDVWAGYLAGLWLEVLQDLWQIFLSFTGEQRVLQSGTPGTLEQTSIRKKTSRI